MTLTSSLIFTVITIIASIGGLLFFRKLIKPEILTCQHDVADPYSQFVGMLFAVLLGFMVADAMARFGDARRIVEQEASSLGNVFRLADGLGPADRQKIQGLCVKYCDQVAHVEWPMLAKKEISPETRDTYRALWKACTQCEPVTPKEYSAQQAILPCMASVGDNRRLRADSLHNGLPTVLWAILVVGGVATIIFTYFFNANNLKLQVVMVGIVSLVICLNIFLLASYDDPFSGDLMVSPISFESQGELFSLEMKQQEGEHSGKAAAASGGADATADKAPGAAK